ncbi:hypothetical protein ACFW84_08240 [Streptomyces anulatus]|uniref:hypothetical protein n=1 Tax=Streptomyces anulatus TaxID=1892 RepID=UPI003694B062
MRDKALVRTYRDRSYVSTAMVQHGGTTVAFAMDDKRRIYYSVLDLEQASAKKGDLDSAYWNAEPALLPFPSEFVDPYADVPVAYPMPVVKAGGTIEVRPQELFGAASDPFLSTTARLTAPVPIQVVSDGRYILVFRQSIAVGHADMVYRTTGNTLTGSAARPDVATVGGVKAAAADASLLCDRYALVGSALKPVVEARYQRSRSKFTPAAGGSDTLGTRDMDGKQFYEPTTRLSFLPRLTDGGFAVLLLPTQVEGVSRWQLFVNNAAEKRIESYNCERTADGLFDVAGTQLWTSPDPRFRKSVLEREPGTDPNTNRPLVPVPATTDRAGTALRFTAGTPSEVRIATAALPSPSGGATFEAWVKATAPGGTVLASQDDSTPTGFRLGLNGQYQPYAANGSRGWQVTSKLALTPGVVPTLVPHTATITERLAAYHQIPDTTGPLANHTPIGAPTTPPGSTPATAPGAALTLPTATIARGTQVTVGYTIPPEKVMPKNWVGIYTPGATLNTGSLHWQYAPDTGGTVSLPNSGNLPAGPYQLWLLANDGYPTLAGPYDLTIA